MFQLPPFVWPSVVMAVCALAVWRGGDDERLGAGAILAGWSLTLVAYRYKGLQPEWGIAAIDLAALALFIWIALRSRRYWPIFTAGFHLLAVVTHLAMSADNSVGGWAYITAEVIWGYCLAFAVGYGAWTAPKYRAAQAQP